MAEALARSLDAQAFGVKAVYLAGSTKNASAGPESDIDLIIHIEDNKQKQRELSLWLDGWSRCLGEINSIRTGRRTDQLLDVHWITDADIENSTSWAVKIDAVTDGARELKTGGCYD